MPRLCMLIAHPHICVALIVCNYSQFSSQADNNFIVISWKDSSAALAFQNWVFEMIFDSWEQETLETTHLLPMAM